MKDKIVRHISWIILLGIVAISGYLELFKYNTLPLFEFFAEKELYTPYLSSTYLTVSIAVLTISALIFTIQIALIQFFSSEIRYKTYENKVLKDTATILSFSKIFGTGILLLIMHLFINFSVAPLTYSIAVISSVIYIMIIIIDVYKKMQNELRLHGYIRNLYDNVEKELLVCMNNIRKLEKIKNILPKINKYFDKPIHMLIRSYAKGLVTKNEKRALKYQNNTLEAILEYDYICNNAYRKGDISLFSYTMNYLSKICLIRIENVEKKTFNPYSASILGVIENHDKVIELKIMPIFNRFTTNVANVEFLRIVNEEYKNVLVGCKSLIYNNEDDYQLTFYIVFHMYIENIKKQIDIGYEEALYDFNLYVLDTFSSFSLQYSSNFYYKLSSEIKNLAAIVFTKSHQIAYFTHLLKLQMDIYRIAISNENSALYEQSLSNVFEMYKISVQNIKNIKAPFTLQNINDEWLDTVKVTSLQSTILNLFNNKYFDKISDKKESKNLKDILDNIYRKLYDNMEILILSSRFDYMIEHHIIWLIHEMSRISLVYITNGSEEFFEVFKKYQYLYGWIIKYKEIKKSFDVHAIQEIQQNFMASNLENKEIFNFLYGNYKSCAFSAFRKICDYPYASRCIENLLWIPVLKNEDNLIKPILDDVAKELTTDQFANMIYDYEMRLKEYNYRSHSLDLFDERVNQGSEKVTNTIHNALNRILEKKKAIDTENSYIGMNI